MGRIAQFTEQQIIEAGVEITESGGHVSAFAIKNHLGGGSHARIDKIWSQYINSLNNPSTSPIVIDKPELPTEMHALLASSSQSASKKIEEMVLQSYSLAEESVRKSLEITLEAYVKKITHLENIEQQAKIALNQSDAKIFELHQQLEKLELINKKLEGCNHRQEGVIESLHEQIQRIEKNVKKTSWCQNNTEKLTRQFTILNPSGHPITDGQRQGH